jgi:hypothetical protein
MICWYCYWGWPKPIADIYDEAVKQLGFDDALTSGPGHSVWADENFDKAERDLGNFDEYDNDHQCLSVKELAIVRWSLEELVKVPMSVRTMGDAYEEAWLDGKDWQPPERSEVVHPRDFPPPQGMAMVKR